MRELIMRRSFLALLFFLGIIHVANAQNYVPGTEDVISFLGTKTMVVLDDNPMSMYNTRIRKAIEQNWNITEYEFILYSDFDKYKKNPAYSFIMTTDVSFERDKLKARYKFLNLLLGGDARRLADMPDLCPLPLAYLSADEDNYLYKLDVFIRFMHNHIELLKKDPKIHASNVFKYYNDNRTGGIKEKTLYILEHELAPEVNTKEKIARFYPYKVEIVSREQMESAISGKDPDVVFLHKVGPEGTRTHARCYKVLIGAGDANFYFFDHHMIKRPKKPDGMMAADFKRIASK